MGDKRSPESHSGAGGWTLRIHDVPANYISTLSLKPASYSGEQKPPDTEESVEKGELEWTWQWPSELIIVKITFAFIIYKNLWVSDDTTRALEDPWVQAPWGSLSIHGLPPPSPSAPQPVVCPQTPPERRSLSLWRSSYLGTSYSFWEIPGHFYFSWVGSSCLDLIFCLCSSFPLVLLNHPLQ